MQEMQGIGLKNIRVQSYDLRSLQVRVVLAVWRHLLEHPLQSIKSHWMRRNAEPKHQWIHHLQDLFSANPHDHRIPDPVALGHPPRNGILRSRVGLPLSSQKDIPLP